jgi:hypothetical protein
MSIENMAVLCVKNTVVKQIVEKFCDDKVIEIDKAKKILDREHWEILNAFKAIDETRCAKLTIGRRGQQTRIRWIQDIKKIIANRSENTDSVNNGNINNEPLLNNASLEQLVTAIKVNYNVSSVHLVY